MAEVSNARALIGIGFGIDLMLDNQNQIVALRQGPGGIEMSIPLCKATDEGVENLKAYIDRLFTIA